MSQLAVTRDVGDVVGNKDIAAHQPAAGRRPPGRRGHPADNQFAGWALHRRRPATLAAALAVLGLLASALPGCGTSQPSRAARSSAAAQAAVGGRAVACRVVHVPVTIPVTQPGQITGDLCIPTHPSTSTGSGRAGTVLLLVGGGGEDADYWSEPTLPQYSLADAAGAAGYATLAIDRLGTGRSTIPSSSTVVTYAAQVSTVDQVAAALHTNPHQEIGTAYATVIGLGHSLGSGVIGGVAAQHPGALAAIIVTGYGAKVTPQTLVADKLYQKPAAQVDPARWGKLDPGYVTVIPSGVSKAGALWPPATTPAAVRVVAAHQGTLSDTELATRPQGAAATRQAAAITIPALVADGDHDVHYCIASPLGATPVTLTPQCGSQQAFLAYERQLLPHACVATALIHNSGHAIQVETAAPAANRLYLAWLAATESGGHARCAITGIDTPASR
jgi:pimeloyl-ACP methyl ester carboxylesterase